MKQIVGVFGLAGEVPIIETGSMLEVTPILKNGRAEIRLRNSGRPPIIVNKIFMWSEGPQRPDIRDLLSDQFLHVAPLTSELLDITEVVLAITRVTGQPTAAVWMIFELDPNCQRFPVRYELDMHEGRITRFVEQYPVH